MKTAQREVTQKGVMKKELPKKYNELPIPEALETAKQRLTAVATQPRRYTKEAEATELNRVLHQTTASG